MASLCKVTYMHSRVPDEAVVIRGGTKRDPEYLTELILDALDSDDAAVVSVQADVPKDGETSLETIERICQKANVPHRQFQKSTAAAIRNVGLEIVADTSKGQAPTHCHVLFSDPVQQSEVQLFIGAFSEPTFRPKSSS